MWNSTSVMKKAKKATEEQRDCEKISTKGRHMVVVDDSCWSV